MGTGVSVFITAFFFIAGFVLGLVYKKIIQKRKIRSGSEPLRQPPE